RYSCIQIQSQTICLALCPTVVARVGEHTYLKERDGLQFFISRGETILLEVVIAALFHDILQRDKAGLILFQALLQGSNGFLDPRTVFACRSLLGLGSNTAIGEDG